MADTETSIPQTSDPLNSSLAKYPFLKAERDIAEKASTAKIEAQTAKTEAELGAKREALEKFSKEDTAKYEEVKSQMTLNLLKKMLLILALCLALLLLWAWL